MLDAWRHARISHLASELGNFCLLLAMQGRKAACVVCRVLLAGFRWEFATNFELARRIDSQ
jgi:hypothetical protein